MQSYGGQVLIEPPAQLQAWIEQRIPIRKAFGFQRPPRLNDPDTDPRIGLEWFLSRPLQIGAYLNPWGASRWGYAAYLVTEQSLVAIRQQLLTYTSLPLVVSDGFLQSVTTNLWMLPAVPLSQCDPSLNLYLLPLVDDRYFWWERAAIIEIDEGATTWSELYGLIADALDITLEVDAIPADYLMPSKCLTKKYQYLPPLLDWVASCVGQRIVRTLDGSFYARNADAALDLAAAQFDKYKKVAGGLLSLGPVTPADHDANVPESVSVIYPRSDDGTISEDDYLVEETLQDLAVANYPANVVGHTGTRLVHSSAVAEFEGGGDPVNDAELQTLAERIATDFYLWRLAYLEIRYTNAIAWTADGLHDQEWTHDAAGIVTSLHRSEWNPGYGDLQHVGSHGSKCEACSCETSSGGEEDWPVEIDSADIVNGTFYAHTLAYTGVLAEDTPCWVWDLAGEVILPIFERYLAERAREADKSVVSIPGGFVFVAITDQTGGALVDGTNWIELVRLTTPGSPLVYLPAVVASVMLVDGGLTVLGSPTDFTSTIDYLVTDADSSIIAGSITTVGTDIHGGILTDIISSISGGTTTYTTSLAFKTITSITVAGLTGEDPADTIQATIHSYPRGVLRTESGTAYATNTTTAGTNIPGVSADWTLTDPLMSAGAGWSVTTAYVIGEYTQEIRPLFIIKSDEDPTLDFIRSINGGTATDQFITSSTLIRTQPNNATTNLEIPVAYIVQAFDTGSSSYKTTNKFKFEVANPGPLSGITDFQLSCIVTGTTAVVHIDLPEAYPTVLHGSMTNTSQRMSGVKTWDDLHGFNGELHAPDSGLNTFGTQLGITYASSTVCRNSMILCQVAYPDYESNTWNCNSLYEEVIDTWTNGGTTTGSIYLAWDGTGGHAFSGATLTLSSQWLLGFVGGGPTKVFMLVDNDWLSTQGATYPDDPFGGANAGTGISNLATIPGFAIKVGTIYIGAWSGITIGGNTIPNITGGLVFAGGLYTGGTLMVDLSTSVTGVLPSANGGVPTGVTFPLGPTNGGTGSDFSLTGPGVVSQPSPGGALTVVQFIGSGTVLGFFAGSGTTVTDDATFDGGIGGTAYTIGDVVRILKDMGALAP